MHNIKPWEEGGGVSDSPMMSSQERIAPGALQYCMKIGHRIDQGDQLDAKCTNIT
jgi:hypothetical protein